MHESLRSLRKFFSVPGGVTQASCLSRRAGILPGTGNGRLGSLPDASGWKPKLRSVAAAPRWLIRGPDLCFLVAVPNRSGAGDVFFNGRIARVGNFSRAGNGDFQRFGDRDFRVPRACRGDFSGLGLEGACL
jgi:hypothetical protein